MSSAIDMEQIEMREKNGRYQKTPAKIAVCYIVCLKF
jgi:hypothetical protein